MCRGAPGPSGLFVQRGLVSRSGPGLQPHIPSGSGASSLGPLAMVTFSLDPRDHSGERGQLGEGADGSHTEPALMGQ